MWRPALGQKVAVKHPLGNAGDREARHGSPHLAADITILEPPYQDRIDAGSRDHAELPAARDGTGEAPIRDRDPHPALYDAGKCCWQA